jgi:hypothetical protein
MAIVDDYAGIATELRRLQAERAAAAGKGQGPDVGDRTVPAARHPMQATPAGELLYRRLVSQRRR